MNDRIAALIGSRICHDLISPIGAIGNGVELLAMTGSGPSTPEMELIADSVGNANARIRFFQIAFGAAKPDDRVSHQDVTSILDAIGEGGRLSYTWSPEGDQLRQSVRIAFLVLQSFETALSLGGTVDVQSDGNSWVLTATGPRLAIDASLWAQLTAPDGSFDFKPAQVHFALVPSALADAGRQLELQTTEDQITARF